MQFTLQRDAAARARRGRLDARARRRRNAGLHAGRHLRHRQGDGAERARRGRRADRARQHVPPVAAPRHRGDRRARRPASLHGLATGRILTDSGGFQVWSLGALRKVQRGRRDVRLAGQRRPAVPDARDLDATIQRALDSDIAMVFDECTPYPGDARRGGGVDGAVAALGARGRSAVRTPAIPTRCSASCRAACTRTCATHRSPASIDDRLRRLRDRRPVGRRAEGGDAAHARAHIAPRLPADKPRYLMGVGTPEDIVDGGRARHRHVRLRAADAQRAQRLAVHALRRRQDPQRAPPHRHAPARRDLRLLHLPQFHAAPTCTTCSGSTKSSARASTRSTTCTTT